jgi:hypothetical protein
LVLNLLLRDVGCAEADRFELNEGHCRFPNKIGATTCQSRGMEMRIGVPPGGGKQTDPGRQRPGCFARPPVILRSVIRGRMRGI